MSSNWLDKYSERSAIHPDELAHGEVERFWNLARSPEPIRLCCLRKALKPGESVKMNRRMEWILQATVGTNPDIRQRGIRDVWIPQLRCETSDTDVVVAWTRLGIHRDVAGQLPLQVLMDLLKLPTCHAAARATLIELIEQHSDGDKLRAFGRSRVRRAIARPRKTR